LIRKVKTVYQELCGYGDFEVVTESQCGLQDCFSRLLHVEISVSGVEEGEDTHLMPLLQLVGLDPADDEDEYEYDFEDEEELEPLYPASEVFDSGTEDSDAVEVVDASSEPYSDGTELEEMVD
jgi:hypothetical protein